MVICAVKLEYMNNHSIYIPLIYLVVNYPLTVISKNGDLTNTKVDLLRYDMDIMEI